MAHGVNGYILIENMTIKLIFTISEIEVVKIENIKLKFKELLLAIGNFITYLLLFYYI